MGITQQAVADMDKYTKKKGYKVENKDSYVENKGLQVVKHTPIPV